MFPWWPITKNVQVIMICQKTWLLVGGAYFPYISNRKLKNLLVRNQWTDFNITLQECFFGDPLPRLFKLSWSSKNMATRGRAYFFLYVYIKNFKNLLVRNHWTKLNVAWQECCFCDPLPEWFKPSWYVKKHDLQGAGLIFGIYLYRKL